jgi:hypothetical protein
MIAQHASVAFSLLVSVALSAPAAAQAAPKRIHIIGASVSGGFEDGPLFGAKEAGDSVSMHHVLKRWCDGEVKVSTHPPMEMCYTFNDPLKIGKKQIDGCKKRKADMVVAVDFPFWFAYGYAFSPKSRLERLEVCIDYLDGLGVPVVIGDLPNMKGAARRMLNPRQIPSEESLVKLNARLQKFAADNDKITMVPMSNIVKQLKLDGVVLPLKSGGLRTPPGALLQGDQLHTTRLGVALLVYRIQDALRGRFPKDHVLHQRKWTFDEFVEAADAEDELEDLRIDLREAAKNKE